MNAIFFGFFFLAAAAASYAGIEPPAQTYEVYSEETFYYEFLNMLLTLGLLVAVLLGGTWLIKRMMNSRQKFGNSSSSIKILEQRSLSTRSALYLIQVQSKTLLIAETQHGVTSLAEFTAPFSKLMDE